MVSPTPPREFSVYAQRSDRLTSRLEGLICAWRIARHLERKLVFFWPKPYHYEEGDYFAGSIFDLKAMARSPESKDLRIVERRSGLRKDAINLRSLPGWPDALDRRKMIAREAHFFTDAMSAEFKGENPLAVQAESRALFALLRPHPLILENLYQAVASLGEEPFTAVHIRRGDIMEGLGRTLARYHELISTGAASSVAYATIEKRLGGWISHFVKRTASLEAYAAALRQVAPGSSPSRRLLVFSDSDSAAREFQQSLPGREMVLVSSFQTALTEIQRSWLEVLLMMRAREIIATNSTFSDFASRYAGIPLVDVRSLMSHAAIHEFFFRSFEPNLRDAPFLRNKCARLLDASLHRATFRRYWISTSRFFKRARHLVKAKLSLG